ncbi:hypothetical protein HRbin39_00986 [bacterium HR39]|nr:hypothetical protein HRbin39_00986 [bacterium HR39]
MDEPRCVFVHTNDKQFVGALVSAHSMKRQSRRPDSLEVRIIRREDFPFFERYQGREYLRGGSWVPWLNEDLQSFTPLRFAPPELMGYRGRAVVVDPDIFAVGDVVELFERDMGGKAIMCRTHDGVKAAVRGRYASSVMLLDCAKLRHWKVEEQFDRLFSGDLDYRAWMGLEAEDPATIGELEPEWNDFDRLTARTKMVHMTRRSTQPWKTGLKMDYLPVEHFKPFPPFAWLMRARRRLFGPYGLLPRYRRHPDPRQEAYFFALLRECLEAGTVTEDLLREHIAKRHVRPDAFEVMRRVPPVDAILAELSATAAA